MEKPSYKLVGAPCGQHGQYTFYKAIRLTGKRERIVAIGDFFFVRIWQDSELVSIGELQLLWTDRVSDQTLVSLRLYFLPENTPDGRCQHGQDEVLAINDKVVVRAEDLLSWVCEGGGWRWGLRAVWRGACAPPQEGGMATAPLHHTKLDFSDVEREKSTITIDEESPGVMVFSYPRYCRYRALLSRLDGIQADWLRDSLVAALGGYAAPTKNTRILYCKDTFEYPELEGHEFVCNHLAPKLKGRPRGRRRRARSRSATPSDDEIEHRAYEPATPRRLSLRNGGAEKLSEDDEEEKKEPETEEDREFLQRLRQFYRGRHESFKMASTLKHLSLRSLYSGVSSRGGYEAVCRLRLWGSLSEDQPARARRHYERFLLPYENHERRRGTKLYQRPNGKVTPEPEAVPTIEVHESPPPKAETPEPSPANRDSETGEVSLASPERPKISVRPVDRLNEVDTTVQLVPAASTNLPQQPDDRPAPNGQPPQATPDQKSTRPAGRSSLRAVRVKATRPLASAGNTTGSNPPSSINNFGIHHPPSLSNAQSIGMSRTPHSDDEIVEVPYKPKTPEIIDLDEYPESPQSVKRKKLEILKERGLEVTAVPPWPQQLASPLPPLLGPAPLLLNPVVQHQLLTHAQLIQMYGAMPAPANGATPPKVIQATSIFGSQGPEKTVYGNPKDPFMPPPHIVHGAPLRAPRALPPPATPPHDPLDLSCKQTPLQRRPAVEIVRVPTSPPTLPPPDAKANLAPNLEITLVGPKSRSPPKRPPQKRSSNGKFASAKTPSPSKTPLSIPSPSPAPDPPKPPIVDPVYMSALYSSLGQMDQRQLAMYRDFVASQFRGYTGLLNIGTPTTKN